MDSSNYPIYHELGIELNEIRERFPSFKVKHIAPALLRHKDLNYDQRIQAALIDLFYHHTKYYTQTEVAKDATFITKIIPNASYVDVCTRLSEIGGVQSRIELVVRDILSNGHVKPVKKLEKIRLKREPEARELVNEPMLKSDNKRKTMDPNLVKNKIYKTNHDHWAVHKYQLQTDDVNQPSTSGVVPMGDPPKLIIDFETKSFDLDRTLREDLLPSDLTLPLAPSKEIIDIATSDGEDEAISLQVNSKEAGIDKNLLYGVMEMFPDADPQYLRNLVRNKEWCPSQVDQIVNTIFETPDYPRRNKPKSEPDDNNIDPDAQLETLKQVLPNADPTYLMNSLQNIHTSEELRHFVSKALETGDYPTFKEYLRKKQLSSQVKQYTTEFSVQKFLELIPDPQKFFNSDKCKAVHLLRNSTNYLYSFNFLKNRYVAICVKQIKTVLDKSMNVIRASNELDRTKIGLLRSKRKQFYPLDGLTDIPLYQVFAYLEHKEDILHYLNKKKVSDDLEREEAKQNGLLKTCQCCYDEEVMERDIVICEAGCIFCKMCMAQSVKIAYSEGRLVYPCLLDCGFEFNLQTLQKTLEPNLFSKIVQKKQLQELKEAGIEDIEHCPFCDFATIPAPGNKLFVCLNEDCMKESCMLCKETSHIPLRCEEVEKDDDVKKRIYIENKMTEALLRKCWKCGLNFIKADGCNKMTCSSCGAMMCYVCNQPVHDYKHFNGQGGERLDLCPLYSDTNLLHKEAVLKSAAEAKQELGEDIKFDPTVGVEDYFNQQMQRNPAVIPPGMNILNRNLLGANGGQNLNPPNVNVQHHHNHNPHNDVLHRHNR